MAGPSSTKAARAFYERERAECLKCKLRMVLRHGAHRGTPRWFWVCPRYPACKSSKLLTPEELTALEPVLPNA